MAKKKPRIIRTIEEWDEWAPVLTAELRDCAGCGEPTYWCERGQRTLGRCPDCAHTPPIASDVSEQLYDRALDTLVAAGFETIPPTTGARERRRPRWLLLRFYWPVDRRWDQRWIWCSPAEAAPLMRKGWDT